MKVLLLFLIFPFLLSANDGKKVKALYNSLDSTSIAQHLALYELYPATQEGKLALQHALKLLTLDGRGATPAHYSKTDLSFFIDSLISLINKKSDGDVPLIEEPSLQAIEKMAERLPNRQLKGYLAKSVEEVLALPWEEVDLSRGLFLTEMHEMQKIRSYEAMIDLMALQIAARLPKDATSMEKLHTINAFIFEELGFRFPPQSLSVKDVDLYTFLPSVLDSRRGVCLGISILYLCLAQRLNLTLETITPPGHIYVRYREGDKIVNIETTQRGVDVESEVYLGLETRSLQQRNIKEVVGLAHMNHAAHFWHKEENEKALTAYRIAQKFLPHDMLLKEFMGLNSLLAGDKEKGEQLLQEVRDYLPDFATSKNNLAEDYLNHKVDAESFKAIFMHVDENRESILKKKEALLKVVEKFPRFRAGLFHLASTWMQLHRQDEALKLLEKLHEIDPGEPTTEYYLAVLYAERLDYNKAWKHLIQAEKIVFARDHHPKALKELRKELKNLCPP